MPKLENRNTKFDKIVSSDVAVIRDFTDLQVWRLARDLRKSIYCLIRKFPPDERFALISQLRRAAISITANIAEGFDRYSYQENIQFSRMARGSAFEIRDHLIVAGDEGYISPEELLHADALAQRVIQTLNGYIRATRLRQDSKHLSKT